MLLSGSLVQSPIHHILTEHEIRETRLLVEQYQLEIEICNGRIEDLLTQSSGSADVSADFEALINETINKKETLERLFVEKSALISPIRHLPSELLALVMTCHVRENAQSPWTLLAVSKSWRYLGIETPRIWSLIHVLQRPKLSSWLPPVVSPFVGGVLCRNEEMWKTTLTRSGAVLIDVVIDCDLSLMSSNFFKLVLESGPRWRSVVYDVTEAGQQWTIDWASAVFSNLQSASFLSACSSGPMTEGLLSAIESTSLKLRSIVLQSRLVELNMGTKPSFLQRIKEMDFTPPPGAIPTPMLGDAIWSRLPRIEVLVLRDEYGSALLSRKDDRFAYLRVFAAKTFGIQILADHCSQLKSLTHVYLDKPQHLGIVEVETHSIELVNVTHFGFTDASYTPLQWFYLPSLIVLELFGNMTSTSSANEEFDLIWNFETFGKAPSPIILHAEVKANDAYLLMALRSMDRVRELYLYYDAPQTASKFMDSLAVKPKKSVVARGEHAIKRWVPPTCPELEALSMVYKKLSKQDRVDVDQKLQQIQEARLGTAREMKELCVKSRLEHAYQTSNLARRYMEEEPYWTYQSS